MKFKVCVLVLYWSYYLSFGNAECIVKRTDGSLLPEIFNITDAESCPIGHIYCKIIVELRPRDEQSPPDMWKVIKKLNEIEPSHFRRDIIYRTVCVKRNALEKEYSEYSSYGLDGFIDESYCFEKGSHRSLTSYDIYLGLIVLSYMAFLVYCNIKTNVESSQKDVSQKANKYFKIFSVANTWTELAKRNKGEDFNKLQSIQGMRTLTMCMIIMAHNFISVLISFSHNPEYVEQLLSNTYTRFLASSFGLLVQIFFTISAWLLSVQLNNIVRKNGKITIKDIFLVSFNRYFRLIPSVVVIIMVHSSPALKTFLSQLLYRSIIELEQRRCTDGWWFNMFFIQNWSCFRGQICSPGTWYLAVDTQLYIMVLSFFYLSQKFKISIKYFFGLAGAVAVCLQGYTVMTTTFNGLIQFTPRLLPGETAFSNPEFVMSYTRTECNLVTYLIGFLFGSIYVENKYKDIFNTELKKLFWFAAFFGLPLVTTVCYHYHSSRVVEALMAVSFRPLYSLGIAIGILGMATGTGGLIKKFFEWRPFVLMGNFTYSVYMFHFAVIFVRLLMKTDMTHFSNFSYFGDLAQDLTLSFLLGSVMYLIFEHPCVQFQKIILPQVKTMKDKLKDS